MDVRKRTAGALIGIALAALLGLVWWVVDLRPNTAEPSAPIESVTTSSSAVPSTPPQSQEPTAQDSAVRPTVARSIVVSGSLRDTIGNLIDATTEDPGVLFIERRHSRSNHASFPAVGAYRIEGLEPGEGRLHVDLRGYEPASYSLDLVPEDRHRLFDVELRRYPRLRVVIEIEADDTDMSWIHSLASIRPVVHEDLGADWGFDLEREETPTEVSGGSRSVRRYTLALHRELPAHVSVAIGDRILDTKEVTEDGQEVRFVVTSKDLDSSLSVLRFTVLDSRRQPPGRTGRYVLRRAGRNDSPEEDRLDPIQTVCRVQPGSMTLEIRVPEHALRRFELKLEPGHDRDLGEIVLEPELTIRGRLVSPYPELIDMANGRLECLPLSDDWRNSVLVGYDDDPTTGTEGRFTIRELGRGRYALRARLGHLHAGPIEVSTESGSVEDLQLRLMETADVLIRFPAVPEGGCKFAIEDVAGLPVVEQWMVEFGSARLLPGRYHIRVMHGGEEIASSDFTAVLPTTKVVLETR